MSCMQQFYRNIYDTIYITGTVKNGSKIVSNALITAYNLDSNYVYHAISNNNGEYLLPSVALGKYKLKAKCNDCLYSTTFYPNKIDSVKSFTINLLGSAIQVDINMILTGIEYESKIETVIYPVPVENELFINTNVKIDKIEILNLLGQTIISTEKFNKSINVESLQNGVYLLKIHVGQNIQILKFEKLQY